MIAVSEDMSRITLYRGDAKHALDSVARLLGRANQALQTLERYRDRLDTVTNALSALEVEDLVTVRDVVTVLQRAEMVRRIAEEIEGYIVELGADGRLARLQLDELLAGVEDERRDVVRDYLPDDDSNLADEAVAALGTISTERLLMPQTVARYSRRRTAWISTRASSRVATGCWLASPGLPALVVNDIVARYGSLQKVMRATTEDLEAVTGVEEATARAVKDGLARLAESSILDRYS